MLRQMYVIDTKARVLAADVDFSDASRIYKQMLAWINAEQSNNHAPRTSVPVEGVRIYETEGFGDALTELFRIQVGWTTPTAEYEGKDFDGRSLTLIDKLIYYDEAKPAETPLTHYDTGLHVPAPIRGRIGTNTVDEETIGGQIYIPIKKDNPLVDEDDNALKHTGDADALAQYQHNKAFIPITDTDTHLQKNIYGLFSFLGVNPRYFTIDYFMGYQVHHGDPVRGLQYSTESPFVSPDEED